MISFNKSIVTMSLYCGLVFLAIAGTATDARAPNGVEGMPHYCLSYCSLDDGTVYDQSCTLNQTCCGYSYMKYCCPDPSLRFYPDKSHVCVASWWSYGWQLMIALMVILMIVLLSMILYTFVCGRIRYEQSRALSQQVIELGVPGASRDFDPTSPCAFEPPRYETLSTEVSREPPKYTEIYTVDGTCVAAPEQVTCNAEGGSDAGHFGRDAIEDDDRGQVNQAFIIPEGSEGGPCPAYSMSFSVHVGPQYIT